MHRFLLSLVTGLILSGCSEKESPQPAPAAPAKPAAPLRVVLTGPADQGFMGELEDSHAPGDIQGNVPMEYPLPEANFSAWFQVNSAPGILRVQVYQGTKLLGERTTTNRTERIQIWSKSNGAVQFSIKP